jgi:tRNA threonylcarbamoyladenosine biosynthesis protein TsaE
MQIIYNLAEIQLAAERILAYCSDKKVWAFDAEMAAGKTTFIHALCKVLQVYSTIGSPTYSLINEYITADGKVIYHMDWYRLKDEEEALQAGVEDCLYSGNLCFIEWPEKAAALLPEDVVNIQIIRLDEQTREIVITL